VRVLSVLRFASVLMPAAYGPGSADATTLIERPSDAVTE
jgi:hypothetical protein